MSPKVDQLDRQMCADALKICASFHYRKASRAVTQLFDEYLAPSGMRVTQFVVLVAMRANEPVTPAALARELIMDRTTLSRNLRPLEKAGLIQTLEARDKRTCLLKLSDKGCQTVLDIVPYWQKAQKQFVDNFGQDRWDEMLRLLTQSVEAARM